MAPHSLEARLVDCADLSQVAAIIPCYTALVSRLLHDPSGHALTACAEAMAAMLTSGREEMRVWRACEGDATVGLLIAERQVVSGVPRIWVHLCGLYPGYMASEVMEDLDAAVVQWGQTVGAQMIEFETTRAPQVWQARGYMPVRTVMRKVVA